MKDIISNEQIKSPQVRVIDNNNGQARIMVRLDALSQAKRQGLDLIQISDGNGGIPVCRIMSMNKYVYELKQKEKQRKKNAKRIETKEIRITPNIADNDLSIKTENARKMLQKGHCVKLTLKLRGRETAHMDLYLKTLYEAADSLKDISTYVQKPDVSRNWVSVMLKPIFKTK